MTRALELSAAGLFSVGFQGKSVGDDLRRLLDRGVGGVICFTRNVGTPEEVWQLNREIKAVARRPILIAVDQEGGSVARLRRGFTELPAMRVVGRAASATLARRLGYAMGRELRAVGFDMDYAPVLDVDTNPNNPVIGARSFAQSPERVAELGLSLADGLQAAGVAACGKHFPGHGDTSQDSHLELPVLPHSLQRLEQVELLPFRAAASSDIAALMTAHVVFQALDASYPATMSRAVLAGILREKLGYQGLVVSDDLGMKAIADHFELEDVVLRGLGAGIDHFLCCNSAELGHRAIDAVVRGVETGKLALEVVENAGRRFSAVKARFAQPLATVPQLDVLRCAEHLELVEQILQSGDGATAEQQRDPTERGGSERA